MVIATGDRYQLLPGLVLGFHGTNKKTAAAILAGREIPRVSTNEYDWLGSGVYFWEHSPQRAYQFAEEKKARGEIASVAVIGAVIDPGLCLNLMEASALAQAKYAYDVLRLAAKPMPENFGGPDLYKRYLDCAVIEMVHELRKSANDRNSKEQKLPEYDTVRAMFAEGKNLYDGAGFRQKTHVQICVRNLACIKGYFKVIPDA